MTLDVAEALMTVGELRREEIPGIAADLLEVGFDTVKVRALAGLIAAELPDAHELLRSVLNELGRQPPTKDEAAVTLARYLAWNAIASGTNLRSIAKDGARLAIALDYHHSLMPFYSADDEYELPEVLPRSEVDRRLLEYSRMLLDMDSSRAA